MTWKMPFPIFVVLFLCSCGCLPHVAASKQEPETPGWMRTLKSICNVIHNNEPLLDVWDWFFGDKHSDAFKQESESTNWMKSIFDKIQKIESLLEAAWSVFCGNKHSNEQESPDWCKTVKTLCDRKHNIRTFLNGLRKVYKVLSGVGQKSPDWRMVLRTFCYTIHMIEPLQDAAQIFLDGDDRLCHYRCSDGNNPVPRPGYKQPPPNGCGSPLFGFQFDIGIPSMTKCCNQHDRCYDTCGQKKRNCDDELHHCLMTMCRKELKPLGSETTVQAVCESAVTLLHEVVKYLGCKPYLDSQKESCVCQYEVKGEL
ncbi:group XIIA secretory phospholipase A2-like isoform X1 [Seriola dumerili]|uniref:group XIIA secretory phospholipase A2-like isoform X1 n=1 Tax=Seriola dumerili TaxID=41447 RepID=UPI000BBF041A|nr:group XIIA secretory phospholipase A2-like isoform X1 [Seriola dumerili]